MLDFSIITIHPRFIEAYAAFGVVGSAIRIGAASWRVVDLRAFAVDSRGTVDDHPYGGGDGMVLRPEPLQQAVASIPNDPFVVLTTPGAKPWTQDEARRMAVFARPVAFICGRFGGIDQRFVDRYVDAEYSVGDFVLSGGELPVLTMVDSILRYVPGVLGNTDSADLDSFSPSLGGMLEYPLYTRPPVFEGCEVPSVLMSGDHQKVAEWKAAAARERTRRMRPDLLSIDD